MNWKKEVEKQRKEIWEKINTSTNAGEQENHKRPGNKDNRTSSLTKEGKEEKRYEGNKK